MIPEDADPQTRANKPSGYFRVGQFEIQAGCDWAPVRETRAE